MLCLDTNILVRFITRDDETQADAVDRLIATALDNNEALFITDQTLCELVWVLRSGFGLSKSSLLDKLERIIYSTEVSFTTDSKAAEALTAFKKGTGDFADYIISAEARNAGCRAVVTFDKKLLKETGFIEPE